MHKIYFGQYRGFSWISKIIRWFTWGSISHTGAFFPPVEGRYNFVIEAWQTGVVKRNWREGHKRGTIIDIYSVECTKEQKEKFYSNIGNEIGKKYDFLGVLGFSTRSYIENPERWFCSELVFSTFKKAGITLLNNIEPYKVSPKLMDLPTLAKHETRLIV